MQNTLLTKFIQKNLRPMCLRSAGRYHSLHVKIKEGDKERLQASKV